MKKSITNTVCAGLLVFGVNGCSETGSNANARPNNILTTQLDSQKMVNAKAVVEHMLNDALITSALTKPSGNITNEEAIGIGMGMREGCNIPGEEEKLAQILGGLTASQVTEIELGIADGNFAFQVLQPSERMAFCDAVKIVFAVES